MKEKILEYEIIFQSIIYIQSAVKVKWKALYSMVIAGDFLEWLEAMDRLLEKE